MRRFRTWASSREERRDTGVPASSYSPAEGVSRQPMMCIRVDLPEPEGPMIASDSPASTSRSMPRSACTACAPASYTLVTPRSRMTGVPGGGGATAVKAAFFAAMAALLRLVVDLARPGRILERHLEAVQDLRPLQADQSHLDLALLEEAAPDLGNVVLLRLGLLRSLLARLRLV